jgi:ABC-type branched-subunit amino acid transport system substrate-binding protein
MRRTIPRSARLAVLLTALMLAAVACSIQAPDVILSGGSGTGNGGTTTGPGGTVTGPGGTVTGPGGTVTGPGGTTTGPGGAASTDTSCTGKVTDTGISASEIKLGGTFAASGPVSNISGPILKGVQAYFNEVNATGGIFGRKIFLKWEDDGWDAQKGKALIKKLVEQDKVFVLTVVPSSNGLDASKTYLEQKGVPVFGTSGLIESQFRSPMQWPVGTGTRSATRIGMLDMKARNVKNAAIIWLDLLAGAEAREAFFEGVPDIFGVEAEDFVTAERQVSLSEASFGPVWASIKSQTESWQRAHGQPVTGIPDYVTLAIDPTNADKALRSAAEINFKPKIGWGGGAPLFLSVVAQNQWARTTGLFAGTSYFPPLAEYNGNAAVQSYKQTLAKYYGSGIDVLNPYLEGGYAGAALTVELLKRAGSCVTRDKVIAAGNNLSNYSAAGLTQPLTYTSKSHYGNLYGLVVQVQSNGTWKVARDWLKDPSPGE